VDYIQAQNGQARIKDNKLVVLRDWPSEAARIKGAFEIVKDLAEKVAEATPKESKAKAAGAEPAGELPAKQPPVAPADRKAARVR
jgi:transcription-repair coupling factor (superfamily II helicase)